MVENKKTMLAILSEGCNISDGWKLTNFLQHETGAYVATVYGFESAVEKLDDGMPSAIFCSADTLNAQNFSVLAAYAQATPVIAVANDAPTRDRMKELGIFVIPASHGIEGYATEMADIVEHGIPAIGQFYELDDMSAEDNDGTLDLSPD